MIRSRVRPVWYWSHDIGWDQFGSVTWPGMRVVSLSGGRGHPDRLRTGTHRGALARPAVRGFCGWYVGLDADGVGGRLECRRAYPVHLDAVRDERGVRYAVVMRR